ncbi:hypothetical protein DB32_000942 [Sandaracinus amylolyticus]|uniref:Uncharacterized protein n=1 Tax=Sandaracinus amylolyticus TaxID=927083 RepID=A0A0F6VZR1_9BACT|nr:hypothetical protein DB32_000942 [Sandaracinus amylolyticus]
MNDGIATAAITPVHGMHAAARPRTIKSGSARLRFFGGLVIRAM